MAVVEGPARGRGSCPSWSLGPGLNIKIKSPLKLGRLKKINDQFRGNSRELLAGAAGGQAEKECCENSWVLGCCEQRGDPWPEGALRGVMGVGHPEL